MGMYWRILVYFMLYTGTCFAQQLQGNSAALYPIASYPDSLLIIPPALSASWTLTLPATAGTSGQFLQTDGSGVSSWQTAPGGGSYINNQSFIQSPAQFCIGTNVPIISDYRSARIANFTTSSTNGVTSYGMEIQTEGVNSGISAVNMGLQLNVSGGYTNYDIYGSNGNWYTDPSGDIGLFGHIIATSTVGTVTHDGTGVTAASVSGSDIGGTITFTSAINTSGTITVPFGTAYTAAPTVILSFLSTNPPLSGNVFSSETVTTAHFVITFSATVVQSNATINYIVIQHP